MNVGTGRGPVDVSTAPDGHGTKIKSETVNPDGSTSTMTTGADNTGMRIGTITRFNGAIGAGFKNIFSGGGQITVVGQDNERVSFDVSVDTSKAFARDQARVRSESIQQTFNDARGLDYMTNLAKQIGASEAYSFLNNAKEMRNSTESYGADLTTALVRNYSMERYGSESPENIRRTISDFNHFLTQQGSQGVNNMQDIVKGFISGNGYGWGNTANEVHDTISATMQRVQAGRVNAGAVANASDTASVMTSGINQNGNQPQTHINQGCSFPDELRTWSGENRESGPNRERKAGGWGESMVRRGALERCETGANPLET
ncbi:MAG: hypothetical protein ACYC9M_04630, partial [Desulfobulbaceae bacterium]